MTRCRGCDTTWTGSGIAHCAATGCHRTFTTVGNFDRHRAGSKDKTFTAGQCSDPSLRGTVQNDRGQWHMPGPVTE